MTALATVWKVRLWGRGSEACLSWERLNAFPHIWSPEPQAMCLYRNMYAVTSYIEGEPLVTVYDWKLSSLEATVDVEFPTRSIVVGLIASA